MNFREWLNKFYHGSLKPLAIGIILQPQPHPGGEAVEVVLSQNKPAEKKKSQRKPRNEKSPPKGGLFCCLLLGF